MTAPISTSNSRFRIESRDHNGIYKATLPYQNFQGEWLLNDRGASVRFDVPYINYPQITPTNLYAGKHEAWVFDNKVSLTDPIFSGPIWDITASSSNGILNISAQDSLSYLAKRTLRVSKRYNNTQGANDIVDLVNYTIGVYNLNMNVLKLSSNRQTSSKVYKSFDVNKISDLITSTAALDDGVEYYMQTLGGIPTLFVYGGLIRPSSLKPYILEYGGILDGYSVDYNAQAIANSWSVIGTNGRVGLAYSTAKRNEYAALYQDTDNADQTATADLNNTAAQDLKASQSTKIISTLVTRKLTPFKDFTYGDQFTVKINDNYVQLNQLIRVTGWQLTIGQSDNITTVIYTKDTEDVS